MFQTNVHCHLHDLVDEGIDEVLDRLKGEAGITGISVAVHHSEIDQLRPHAGVSPRRFRSVGGAQFQPDTSRYRSTRMRPIVADWLHKRNPIKAVADACSKRKLTLRASIACCESTLLASRYEANCIKDVLDQPSTNRLCPVNLDVREYLAALVEDLSSNHPFEAIELDQIAFPSNPSSAKLGTLGFECGETGDWLRSLCFCESCRQLAARDGVDVENASQIAQKHLEHILATGEPLTKPVAEFIKDNEALQNFVDWRCQQITSLIKLIKGACKSRLIIHRNSEKLWAATNFPEIAQHCDAFLVTSDEMDSHQLTQRVTTAASEIDGVDHIELGLNACTPPCPDSAALVANMKQAVDLGVRSVSISNYGLIPLSRLEWIRQATRYAGRETK